MQCKCPTPVSKCKCKCLRQLVVRGSDQLKSLSSFGHFAHFTFHDLRDLLFYFFLTFVMYFNFCSNLFEIVQKIKNLNLNHSLKMMSVMSRRLMYVIHWDFKITLSYPTTMQCAMWCNVARNTLATDVLHGTIFSATGTANRVVGWRCAKKWRQACYTKQLEQNSWFGLASFWSWFKNLLQTKILRRKSSTDPCYTSTTSLRIAQWNITFSIHRYTFVDAFIAFIERQAKTRYCTDDAGDRTVLLTDLDER